MLFEYSVLYNEIAFINMSVVHWQRAATIYFTPRTVWGKRVSVYQLCGNTGLPFLSQLYLCV